MSRVAVTGGAGFLGSHLLPALLGQGFTVRAVLRGALPLKSSGVEQVVVGDLSEQPKLDDALRGIDAVVHLAGRVHVMRERASDPRAAFRRANVDATRHLAEQAAVAGVRRFVFLSSIKVNGERTEGRPFTEVDAAAPQDAYAWSKWAAEQSLHEVAEQTGLEVSIIRPPLVYGPGVRANFLRLMRLAQLGVPLPLGSIDNRRSMVSQGNLCDLITHCLRHPAAAGEVFLASDQHDLSTPELIRLVAAAMGRPARLFPCPLGLLRRTARAVGMGPAVGRMLDSLQVDSTKATRLLGWTPLVPVGDALRQTVSWYLAQRQG
jgi:nucleoside-diphosphate-sugar epimerase